MRSSSSCSGATRCSSGCRSRSASSRSSRSRSRPRRTRRRHLVGRSRRASIISIPFVFSGIVVCLALTRFPDRVNRLYAADLVGAALGCVAARRAALSCSTARALVIAVAALAAVGARVLRARCRAARRACWLAVVAIVVLRRVRRSSTPYTAHDGHALAPRSSGRRKRGTPTHVVREVERLLARHRRRRPERPTPDRWHRDRQHRRHRAPVRRTPRTRRERSPRPDLEPGPPHPPRRRRAGRSASGGGRDVLSALVFDQQVGHRRRDQPRILHFANDEFGDFTGHLDQRPAREVRERRGAQLPRPHRQASTTSSRSR